MRRSTISRKHAYSKWIVDGINKFKNKLQKTHPKYIPGPNRYIHHWRVFDTDFRVPSSFLDEIVHQIENNSFESG